MRMKMSQLHLTKPGGVNAENSRFSCSFIDGGTMLSPTVFARRGLSYLMSEMPNEALHDAMQALVVSPNWLTAFYLQAAALFTLGMEKDAQESLKEATNLETKRHII